MNDMPLLKLAIVDDHMLFRKGLIGLIEVACTHTRPVILFEANDGKDMIAKLQADNLPDILIMDVNMPVMNGYESVAWLRQHYPKIKVLVVSMVDKEEGIIRMLSMGVKGYLSKDVEPEELGAALEAIAARGYYYTDYVTGKLVQLLVKAGGEEDEQLRLTHREEEFLELVCSDYTYNEIATKMFLSPKTIEGYRSALFQRLGVKSRVGLALYAVKEGLVKL